MLNKYLKENLWFIGIVGSKERNEKRKIKEILQEKRKKYKNKTIIVVSGGAKGIDNDVEFICKQLGIIYIVFPPKLEEYQIKGNDIYFERNYKIAEISNELIAFPIGFRCGTMNTINYFKKLGKEKNLVIY